MPPPPPLPPPLPPPQLPSHHQQRGALHLRQGALHLRQHQPAPPAVLPCPVTSTRVQRRARCATDAAPDAAQAPRAGAGRATRTARSSVHRGDHCRWVQGLPVNSMSKLRGMRWKTKGARVVEEQEGSRTGPTAHHATLRDPAAVCSKGMHPSHLTCLPHPARARIHMPAAGGNAAKDGRLKVGDVLVGCSATLLKVGGGPGRQGVGAKACP